MYAATAETIDEFQDIRTMLVYYVGSEMDTLMKYGGIKDLLLENGEILSDFLKMFVLNMG